MHWNEKIDLLKKHFSSTEFMVPHVDRKKVLRQIESKFISRFEGYYFSNAHRMSFVNWNGYQKAHSSYTIAATPYVVLQALMEEQQNYWVALEGFESAVMLYKANRIVTQHLHALCYWSNCTHVVSLKFDFLLTLEPRENCTVLKIVTGENQALNHTLLQRANDLAQLPAHTLKT